jgi:hypothetical protein
MSFIAISKPSIAAHNTLINPLITLSNGAQTNDTIGLQVGAFMIQNANDSSCIKSGFYPRDPSLNSCRKLIVKDFAPAQTVAPKKSIKFTIDKTIPLFSDYSKTRDVDSPKDVKCNQADEVMYIRSTDSFAVCDHVASATQGFYPRFYKQFFIANSVLAGISNLNYQDGSIEDQVKTMHNFALEIYSWKADTTPLVTLSLDRSVRNYTLKDGPYIENAGMYPDEDISYTDVSIKPEARPNCFVLHNRTPRFFKSLPVSIGGTMLQTGKIDAFTDSTYCANGNLPDSGNGEATFTLGKLPNPYYNMDIHGFWAPDGPDYTGFTIEQKKQFMRALSEARYVINHDDFAPALRQQIINLGETAILDKTDAMVEKLRSGKKKVRIFMMLKETAEGLSAGSWIAIVSRRYNTDANDPHLTGLVEVVAHEMAHQLGFPDSNGAYAIGYAVRAVVDDYYKKGILNKLVPNYE